MTRAEWDAMSPRERDALVAEKVMGLDPSPLKNLRYSTTGDRLRLSRYTTTPEGMMAVVEKMRGRGFSWELYSPGGLVNDEFAEHAERWRAGLAVWFGDGWNGDHHAEADTLPEAVALAALTALGHMEEG